MGNTKEELENNMYEDVELFDNWLIVTVLTIDT